MSTPPEPAGPRSTADPGAVALEGALNCRDLGGRPTVDGRSTRPGVLFRSDSLRRLTARDVTTLLGRGVTANVDLQSEEEIAYFGRGLLGQAPITWIPVHESALRPRGERPEGEGDVLLARYREYLAEAPAAFVRAVAALAQPGRLPAVINCFFGKDRTGVLCALVLDSVGVTRDAIVADYAASALRLPALLARLRDDPDPVVRDTVARTPSPYLEARPATMAALLDDLAAHGGARGWLLAHGAAPGDLDVLRERLVGADPRGATTAPLESRGDTTNHEDRRDQA
ncbi:MAG: tyrosine-protein phosphatase [Acidimicrobiales bacterium]